MRRPFLPAVFAAALLTPLSAFAGEPNCPPGSWFCADPTVDSPQAAPDEDGDNANNEDAPELPKARPQQRAEEEEDEASPQIEQDRGPVRRPRVVVTDEQGGYATPPNVVIVTRGRPHVRRIPPPRLAPPPVQKQRQQPRLYSKWGLNLRVQGAAMGDGADTNAGMGGLGLSLRYRPVPHFGFDVGVDIVGGTDWNGFSRVETPVSLNAMIFVNPKSRVQFYLIGGAHLSHAEVRSDTESALLHRVDGGDKFGADYDYFGGQGGAGLEFRLGRRVGLSFDALAFFRQRTDDGQQPEFVNAATGQTSNTSAGLLFRGGLNFWW